MSHSNKCNLPVAYSGQRGVANASSASTLSDPNSPLQGGKSHQRFIQGATFSRLWNSKLLYVANVSCQFLQKCAICTIASTKWTTNTLCRISIDGLRSGTTCVGNFKIWPWRWNNYSWGAGFVFVSFCIYIEHLFSYLQEARIDGTVGKHTSPNWMSMKTFLFFNPACLSVAWH